MYRGKMVLSVIFRTDDDLSHGVSHIINVLWICSINISKGEPLF